MGSLITTRAVLLRLRRFPCIHHKGVSDYLSRKSSWTINTRMIFDGNYVIFEIV